MTPAGELATGVAQLGLNLSAQTQQALLDFLTLLEKWNRVYNLTGVRDRREMVSQHLLDCLAIVPHVRAASILDAGSGGGFPGIPLALACPDAQVTLLDSSEKKAAFLRQALIELAIGNATVVRARAEDWHPGRQFELVVSRAFSSLAQFAARCGHLVAPGGVLGAMKGAYPRQELGRLPRGFRLRAAHALSVPGLYAERHLLLIARD